MEIFIVFLLLLLVYLIQCLIAAIFNLINFTKVPCNFKDLVKLMWLPYVLKNRDKIKW